MISLSALSSFSQNAKTILDKTVATYEKGGGIEAAFDVKVTNKTETAGTAKGTILLDDNKFILETGNAITWFDGKTQWSYMAGSDEVNISNPTEEELQSINPYALLKLYRENYTYKMGDATRFQGKAVYEINLAAKDKKKEITKLALYIDRSAYQPLFIMAELRDGSRNEITIREYKTGLKHDKNIFLFDSAKYPNAEIIDLRDN